MVLCTNIYGSFYLFFIFTQIYFRVKICLITFSLFMKNRRCLDVATSKAAQRAVNKYMKENYDRVNLTMPKGKKEAVQAYASQFGESVNAFINRAIDEAMQRDTPATTEE